MLGPAAFRPGQPQGQSQAERHVQQDDRCSSSQSRGCSYSPVLHAYRQELLAGSTTVWAVPGLEQQLRVPLQVRPVVPLAIKGLLSCLPGPVSCFDGAWQHARLECVPDRHFWRHHQRGSAASDVERRGEAASLMGFFAAPVAGQSAMHSRARALHAGTASPRLGCTSEPGLAARSRLSAMDAFCS